MDCAQANFPPGHWEYRSCTPDTPEKSGWSVAQLIYTSTITCHFTDESGDFYLDVFSCKEFEIEKVIECVDEFFSPLETKSRYLLRE